jgi:hypothetical protein
MALYEISDRVMGILVDLSPEACGVVEACVLPTMNTGPWADGSKAEFTPWTDGDVIGFYCVVNGVASYVYLNPSSSGDSPDVFVYGGPHGGPDRDTPHVFVTPDGTP